MNFNDKVDKYMAENNIKDLKKLALLSDIPYTTLRDFYNKKSADNSRLSTIRKLSEYMNCSLDYLAFDENTNFDNAEVIDSPSEIILIPIYGTIKAGVPLEGQTDIIEYMEIPKNWTKGNKKLFGLQISGDSMYPKYHDGEKIIFEQTNDLETYKNKDCAVMINHTESTFKKVIINDNGMLLQPYNSEYDIMPFTNEEIENLPIIILGVAKKRVSDIE